MKPCKHRYSGGGCSLGIEPMDCRTCSSYAMRTQFDKAPQKPSKKVAVKVLDSTMTTSAVKASEIAASRTSAVTEVRGGCNCRRNK